MALVSNKSIDGTSILLLSHGSEKKVTLVCDACGKKSTASYSNYISSQIRYHRHGETYCRTCSNKKTGALKRGRPMPKACGPRPSIRREAHPNYGGGRWVASDGYVMILVGTRQYKREHILIMEKRIGRRVKSEKGEVVHHIDLDRVSNSISNLVLLPNERAHRAAHNSLMVVVSALIKAGRIKFNRTTNTYRASK